jgi:hypothetical protein
MSESDAQTVLILLYAAVALLVLLVVLAIGIRGRLARLERRMLDGPGRAEASPPTPSLAETSTGGAFETFLSEDPARRDLPKKEQFAEYRKWRQENGMNWSNS